MRGIVREFEGIAPVDDAHCVAIYVVRSVCYDLADFVNRDIQRDEYDAIAAHIDPVLRPVTEKVAAGEAVTPQALAALIRESLHVRTQMNVVHPARG